MASPPTPVSPLTPVSSTTPEEPSADPPATSGPTPSTETPQASPPPGSSATRASVTYRPLELTDHEPLVHYRPGGYHPVAFDDELGGRFVVRLKLGYGAFGMVWMCWDKVKKKMRAVKIMKADESVEAFNSELGLLALLSEGGHHVSTEEAYENHLGVPLEYFWQEGANGRHLCLVMPVLGPGVWRAKALGDVDFLKDVCAQVTGGLAFLHSKGVTHGDLHADNILFQTSLDEVTYDEFDELSADYDREPLIAEGRESPGPHAPVEIYPCVDWAEIDKKYIKKEVAIIDFGACHKSSGPPECETVNLFLMTPEQFFDSHFTQASDLWALGYTMMHILGSKNPFEMTETDEPWYRVRVWEDALGPLPQVYRHKWIEKYIEPKGSGNKRKYEEMAEADPVSWEKEELITTKELRLEEHGTEDIFSAFLAMPAKYQVQANELEDQEQENSSGPGDPVRSANLGPAIIEWSLPREEIESAVNLIKCVMKYDPDERMPASDLLKQPFLAGRNATSPPPPAPPRPKITARRGPARPPPRQGRPE